MQYGHCKHTLGMLDDQNIWELGGLNTFGFSSRSLQMNKAWSIRHCLQHIMLVLFLTGSSSLWAAARDLPDFTDLVEQARATVGQYQFYTEDKQGETVIPL